MIECHRIERRTFGYVPIIQWDKVGFSASRVQRTKEICSKLHTIPLIVGIFNGIFAIESHNGNFENDNVYRNIYPCTIRMAIYFFVCPLTLYTLSCILLRHARKNDRTISNCRSSV